MRISFQLYDKLRSLHMKLLFLMTENITTFFHLNLLQLTSTDPLPDQISLVSLLIVNENSESQYEVNEILDFWVHQGKLQFRVRWIDYTQSTWESFDNVKTAVELLNKYFKNNLTQSEHQIWNNYDSDDDADSDDDSDDEVNSDYEN